MYKISACQGCGTVSKLTGCNSCYALVCGNCVFSHGCKLCMGGRRLNASLTKA